MDDGLAALVVFTNEILSYKPNKQGFITFVGNYFIGGCSTVHSMPHIYYTNVSTIKWLRRV